MEKLNAINTVRKWTKNVARCFTEEYMQITNKDMKRGQLVHNEGKLQSHGGSIVCLM